MNNILKMDTQVEPPPPPYCELDNQKLSIRHSHTEEIAIFKIPRKPLRSQKSLVKVNVVSEQPGKGMVIHNERTDQHFSLMEIRPLLPPRPDLSLKTSIQSHLVEHQYYLRPDSASIMSAKSDVSVEDRKDGASSPASPVDLSELRIQCLKEGGSGISDARIQSLKETASVTSESTPSSLKDLEVPVNPDGPIRPPLKPSASSYIQTAYREARHFAGGLISHPYESTKHFTILRHSHGLVFYRGSNTRLAITVFATEPLLENRTYWILKRGWGGDTGMKFRSIFGKKDDWIPVTPTMELMAEQLKLTDERAWQRDIATFKKKAKPKIREKHQIRETALIRIPVEASDGYFQFAMCAGEKEKVVCLSPAFRILSLSTDPAVVRGATLMSMPLEAGIKIATPIAKAAAMGAASKFAAPAVALAKSKMSTTATKVTEKVYSTTTKKMAGTKLAPAAAIVQKKVETKIKTSVTTWMTKEADEPTSTEVIQNPDEGGSWLVVGNQNISLDMGPSPPFPIYLEGRSQFLPYDKPQTLFAERPGFLLRGVPDYQKQQLYGYYFGWCRFKPTKKEAETADIGEEWHQTIITSLPPDHTQLINASISLTTTNLLTIYIIDDLDSPLSNTTLLEIYTMGFLRVANPFPRQGTPLTQEESENATFIEANDLCLAQAILDEPNWGPSAAREILRGEKVEGVRKFAGGLGNARAIVERGVGRVPVHLLGVRREGDLGRDLGVVSKGFFIRR